MKCVLSIFNALCFFGFERIRTFTIFFVKVKMSNINLETLSVDELKKLSAQAGELIQDKEDTMIRDTYEEIKRLAKNVNMTVDEIAVWGNNQARKRKQVDVKYRDPCDPNNTWTGRGIKPRWLKHEIEVKGRKLSEFAIA